MSFSTSIEGEFEVTLMQGAEPENFVAPAGSSFVIPQGIWHAPSRAKFTYLTPGTTLHSEAEDPRQDST
ncbi:MAG: hypothetical protein AAF329_00325 [Cyanobacteria bacterium P01_A01_bin.17]